MCKKGLSVLKAVAAKGIEQRHLFLLYQSLVLSVIDYGQGLKTMAQANLLNTAGMSADRTQVTKECERYPTDSGVSTRHSCLKTWKSTVENGHQAEQSEIKLLIQENSKPQDLIVYTDGSVTKDRSGWGFTVKEGATAIYELKAVQPIGSQSPA